MSNLNEEIKKRNITSSGIIHYDEEFFTKNKEKYVRLTLLDSKTRPEHAQLHGLIFRYDDPFWPLFHPCGRVEGKADG